MQTFLKNVVAFAYGQNLSYRPPLRQMVTVHGSVHSSSFCCEYMRCCRGNSDDDEMEVDNGSDYSNSWQVGRVVVTYFSQMRNFCNDFVFLFCPAFC